MRTVADRIRHLDPCQAAWAWADDYTDPAKAWADCPNGSWMLWLLGHSERSAPWSEERKPLLACCLDLCGDCSTPVASRAARQD